MSGSPVDTAMRVVLNRKSASTIPTRRSGSGKTGALGVEHGDERTRAQLPVRRSVIDGLVGTTRLRALAGGIS